MRIRNLKTYYLKNRVTLKDEKEGGRWEAFSPAPVPIQANIYDKEQKLTGTDGGMVLDVHKKMLVPADGVECKINPQNRQEMYIWPDGHILSAGDGICVNVPPEGQPDYRITSILWQGHLVCRLERI